MKTLLVSSLIASSLFVTGCSDPAPIPVQQPIQQPMQVQQPVQPQVVVIEQDNSVDGSDLLVAGAIGAAAGYAMSSPSRTTSYPSQNYSTYNSKPVVKETVVTKTTTVVQQKPVTPVNSLAPAKPNLTKPSPTSTYTRPSERRTYTTKTTTVTKTTRSSSSRRR